MPVYSMTGYANASASTAAASENQPAGPQKSVAEVSIELRSVNSRFLDIVIRAPDELRGVEPLVREVISSRLRRGKVEARLTIGGVHRTHWPQPRTEQLHALSVLESAVQSWLPHAAPFSVQEALQWCQQAALAPQLDAAVPEAAERAVAGLLEARAREGDKLTGVLRERLAHLRELSAAAQPLMPQMVARQQERFLVRWREALEAGGASQVISEQAVQERALNEAAAFAIRIDVAEELARLAAHLDEIDRLLTAGGEIGKRMDFLIQELQREANTLGAKSAALELTQLSIDMKVAIEQMREQVQNIE